MRPVHVFVARDGNAFMRDIASWIVEAARLLGRPSELHADGSVPRNPQALNLVVAPHEFYPLSDLDDRGIELAARSSVPICTEQPGTRWFEIGLVAARRSPLVLDINSHGAAALAAEGLDARHLRLGGVPSMMAPAVDRDLDLIFLGGRTGHRAERLAALAPTLWDREVDLRLFSFRRPVGPDTPGLVFDDDKYRLLARSRLLLNIHRDDRTPGYFEWARMVEAMANGCCIVTEPVTDHAPYVDGEHFIATDDLAGEVRALLDDPQRAERVGSAARVAVLDEHPLTRSLGPLLDEIESLAPPRPIGRFVPRLGRRMHVAQGHPLMHVFRPALEMRARVHRSLMAEAELQREIGRVRCILRHGVDDHVERVASESYDGATPDVSVIVTLFDYGHVVTETLDSIVASEGVSLEVVVIDDRSTDDGRTVVAEYVAQHPDVPMLLLASDVNRGLPASRNLAIESARADKIMVMDADNLVYPNALRLLVDALDRDQRAAFAYSTLEEFGVAPGVRSAMAWNPEWLCEENYIDAQAMVRRSVFERHGGYRLGDDLVFGWEDWELWLRLAAAGEHGVHVPRMLGRYRTQEHSMISTTNLAGDDMMRHLRELHPGLPWPP